MTEWKSWVFFCPHWLNRECLVLTPPAKYDKTNDYFLLINKNSFELSSVGPAYIELGGYKYAFK